MNQVMFDGLVGLKEKMQKEIAAIDKLIFDNPAEDFFAVHKDFQALLDSGMNRRSTGFLKKLGDLAAREKAAKRRMTRFVNTKRSSDDIERKVQLEFAICWIENQLWMEKEKRGRYAKKGI